MKNQINTKSLITTALFVAIALVMRAFSINIVAGGVLTMKINFSAIFYILPGFLFGPLYGGIAGGLIDILGYFITPIGAYIPLITLTNVIAGFLPAVLLGVLKRIDSDKIRKFYGTFFILMFLVGLINFISVKFMPLNPLGKMFIALGKKSQYLGTGLMLIASIGILILLVSMVINKSRSGRLYEYINSRYFKFVVVIGISGAIVTTLNTYILLIFTPSLITKGFMVLWIPRMFESLFITLINSYIVCMLMYYYELLEKKVLEKA
ncbi:ECF transporter S component (folate family) [Clostridium algifaecis]|uniref:ECF transporter S component (Folate family) n=1 Tax=Clostridium algifaecis TaxID=1472040 RepID=A0ABS4KPY2_9CLOT|nr:ECF transporter S component [Clostridium algifaecis]MBP2032100.1 ECF transporter S component (folate family) [Clostridium algifaecis]